MLTNQRIQQRIKEKFADQVSKFEEPYGMLTFEAPKNLNLKVLNFLYDDEELKFRFLTTLCAVHYPDNKGRELAIVYHLHNLVDNVGYDSKYTPILISRTSIQQRVYFPQPTGSKEKLMIFME